MIKLKTTVTQNKADIVAMTTASITINGKKHVFANLTEDDTKPCYKTVTPVIVDEVDTGETIEDTHILLCVPKSRKFMFHSGNLKRFFDIDSNNIIDISELKTAINYINEVDDFKLKANLKSIRDNYLANHTRDEWNAKGI
jgi:hypothetical protein